MIDTFACCGKSIGEKILLPNLFKQAVVEFSFFVTNLTFQESDSSLAEKWTEKHYVLEAPKIQVRYGIPLDVLEPQYWSRAENMVGRCDMKYPASLNKETKDAFVKTAIESFIACLSAQAHCVFVPIGLILPFMTYYPMRPSISW